MALLSVTLLAATLSLLPAGAVHAGPPQRGAEGWTEEPTSSLQADLQPCADHLFIGVRGSQEPRPYGPTVTRVRDGLARDWKHGSVRQVWLEYPAGDPHTLSDVPLHRLIFERPMPSTVYFDSADSGGQHLSEVLLSQQARCPTERVILAGFSQGAQVITRALALTGTSVTRVAAAILVGNPSHYPRQNVQELSGDSGLNATGLGAFLHVLRQQAKEGDQTSRDVAVRNLIEVSIAMSQGQIPTATLRRAMVDAGAEIPAESYARTYSVCRAGDMVCDAAPAMTQVMVQTSTMAKEIDETRPIHNNYSETVLRPTLDEVTRYLNSLPPVVRPTASPGPSGSASSSNPGRGPDDAVAPGPPWPWIGAVVGAGLAGMGIGFVLGRRTRRQPPRAAPAVASDARS